MRFVYRDLVLVCLLAHLCQAAIRELPSNISIIIGSDVTFNCASDPLPPGEELISQWKSSNGMLLGVHNSGRLPGHQGRYSYIKKQPEQLDLSIERVTLEDDGQFECQMLSASEGPSRAQAYLNVIVPPQEVDFAEYKGESKINVVEGVPINISCVVANSKPQVDIDWYLNGKLITDEVIKKNVYNHNKTVTSTASFAWRPRKADHGNTLTCQAYQKESEVLLKSNLSLNVLYSSERPVVKTKNDASYLRQGENVSLLCLVRGGNPPPSVVWYLRDKPISNRYVYDPKTKETINTHTITLTAADNFVGYECRAINKGLTNILSSDLQLNVAYGPDDVDIFGDITVVQGESTSLQCTSKPSNPPAKILWTVNGQAMATDQQIQQKTKQGIIAVSNLTVHANDISARKHRIVVECTAQNPEGSTSRQHVIKLLEPPKSPVIIGLDDIAHMEGDIVNVTCEAIGGYPLAELTWYRGSNKLPGARATTSGNISTSVISIPLERNMNNQLLTCEASNTALKEPLRTTRQLNVLFPPRRVSVRLHENQHQQLLAGKETRLICSAMNSNPPAEISWHFYPNGDSNPIISSGETIVNETIHDSGYSVENSIVFIPVEGHDGTVVRCFASSPVWSYSKNASLPLSVYYPPRFLGESPIEVVVSEGDFFRKNFTVKGNPPISAWRWKKNGIPFDHTIGNVFARGTTLTGRIVKSTDAGVYTVTAINSIGTTNITIKLIVEYGARITSISSPIIASEGEMILIECEAEAEPKKPGMLKWMRNEKDVNFTLLGETRALLRINVSDATVGEYTCIANNGIGQPSISHTYVLVNTPPRIFKIPSLSRAAGPLGGRARARCRVSAVPEADFAWDRAGDFIKGNSSKYTIHNVQLNYSIVESTLMIHNLAPNDFETPVRCTARNSLGIDSFVIPVGPPTAPATPSDIEMVNATSNSISIAWEPGFDGGSDQTFEVRYQKDDEDVVHGLNTSLSNVIIPALHPGSIYNIRLRAINARGFSSKLSNPAFRAATRTQNGSQVTEDEGIFDGLFQLKKFHYIIIATILLFCNCVVCCFIHRKHQQKQLKEKTEIIRTAINGDRLRPVQMYGTMMQMPGPAHDEIHDLSEDDHSVKTMIEINSNNNNMQQIRKPTQHLHDNMMDCDVYYQDLSNHHMNDNLLDLSGGNVTYSQLLYADPSENMYNDTLGSRGMNSSPRDQYRMQHLSTFVQPSPSLGRSRLQYAQLKGDLV